MTGRDPLTQLAGWLINRQHADQGVLDRIHTDVKAEIDSAAQFAINAPFPDVSEVNQQVYA